MGRIRGEEERERERERERENPKSKAINSSFRPSKSALLSSPCNCCIDNVVVLGGVRDVRGAMTITLLLALPVAACFTTSFTRRWKRPRSHAHHHAIHLELCACTILIHIVDGGGWVKLVAKQAPPNIGVRRSVASIITVVMIIRCSDFFFNSFYDTVQYENVVFE